MFECVRVLKMSKIEKLFFFDAFIKVVTYLHIYPCAVDGITSLGKLLHDEAFDDKSVFVCFC